MKRLLTIVFVFSALAAVGLSNLPASLRSATAPASASQLPPCEWVAGDLHAHANSRASATADALTMSELGQNAAARELDYLLVANPNEITDVADPAFGSEGIAWFIGYEKRGGGGSLILGAPGLAFSDSGDSPRDLIAIARSVRQGSGFVQIGRPETSHWPLSLIRKLEPETVEVWRGGPFNYPTPGLGKSPVTALALYDRMLDDGIRVSVSGGSDTASRAISDVAGVGQPTTWVCADSGAINDVARAIDLGRTTISHESPDRKPALVFLEADSDDNGTFEARMGDDAPAGSTFRVSVQGAPAVGLRLVTDGSSLVKETIVDSLDYTLTFRLPASATWVRAEIFLDESISPRDQRACELHDKVGSKVDYCEGAIPMLGVSSPIYVTKTN
jgi:hypothetical protein